MQRIPFLRAVVLSLVLGLAMAGCEHTGELAPTAGAPQAGVVQSESGEQLTMLEDRIPADILDLEVSKLIGIDGGQLSLAGHRITVPAGAVDVPTLFTMTLKTNGYVDVELSATVTTLLGEVIDVGKDGFNEPVTLTLSFARSPNAPEDASGIRVLRMLGPTHDDPHEVLPTTVDAEGKTASAELEHFSGYCLAD